MAHVLSVVNANSQMPPYLFHSQPVKTPLPILLVMAKVIESSLQLLHQPIVHLQVMRLYGKEIVMLANHGSHFLMQQNLYVFL